MEASHGFHDLLARAQAGDRQAVEQLLAVIRPWLEQQARGYADPERPDQSTSDLTQEAWLRAWQKLDQFHGAADDEQTLAMFQAWIGKIVRHLGLNAVRDRGAGRRKPPGKLQRLDGAKPSDTSGQRSPEPPGEQPTPSANVGAEEEGRQVREALERIPDSTDREIVRLRFFESLSLRQVAQRLGLNHEHVRERYHAVLRRLEQDLGDLR